MLFCIAEASSINLSIGSLDEEGKFCCGGGGSFFIDGADGAFEAAIGAPTNFGFTAAWTTALAMAAATPPAPGGGGFGLLEPDDVDQVSASICCCSMAAVDSSLM